MSRVVTSEPVLCIDRLRQLGHIVIGVHFGGKASRPRYQNKRTEYVTNWWNVVNWEEVARRIG